MTIQLDWLCDLALHLEKVAWELLSKAHHSGGRFSVDEEKVTHRLVEDIYLEAERTGHGDRVWVRDFGRGQEAQNGADLEVWITRNQSEGFAWRIQAKRLYAAGAVAPPRYNQLDHTVSGVPQYDLLISSCATDGHIAPMYWLYGFDATSERCDGSSACRCSPGGYVSGGLLVARASLVKSVLLAGGESKSFHRWARSAGVLLASPLHDYWCVRAGASGSPDEPDPFDVLRAVSSLPGQLLEAGQLPDYVLETMRVGAADAPPRSDQTDDSRSVPAVVVVDVSTG